MPEPITTGAALLRALRESGTPDYLGGPLDAGRQPVRADRNATAAAVVAALEAHLGADHGTAVKARRLMETGEAAPADHAAVPTEDQILGLPPGADGPGESAGAASHPAAHPAAPAAARPAAARPAAERHPPAGPPAGNPEPPKSGPGPAGKR